MIIKQRSSGHWALVGYLEKESPKLKLIHIHATFYFGTPFFNGLCVVAWALPWRTQSLLLARRVPG